VAAAAPDYSDDFVDAARAEVDRLRLDAERLRQEAARHLELAERATAAAIVVEQRVRELDELLGRAPQLRLDLQTAALRGKRLRETAIEILVRRRKLRQPIHYRAWFELVLAEGHSVDGKDPLATFLTQVTRSPAVLRESDRPGVYRVDPEAGGEAALRELDAARAALTSARQELADAKERPDPAALDVLTAEVGAAERRLVAAERAFGEVARIAASACAEAG
jgi:hypothetical protein